MNKRLSSQELYYLRNHLNIRLLIQNFLNIPAKDIENVFRFLCPICYEFQTAINQKTNLSRCFRCKRNFNTIELVMLDRKLPFLQAVKFLQNITPDFQAASLISSPANTSCAVLYPRHLSGLCKSFS